MKRSWIWIICIVIGFSFLSLLYLQSRYAAAMVKMRSEQFDENVIRSLDQASRELEKNETLRYLQSVLKQHEQDKTDELKKDSASSNEFLFQLDSTMLKYGSPFQKVGKHPSRFPSSLTMPRPNQLAQALAGLQEHVRDAYVYERGILDEVIYAVMYTASDLNFRDRLDPLFLEYNLRVALQNNGITIPFHFAVYTSDGREVYRCQDFSPMRHGESPYTQILFRSDPTGQMGYVQLHFPNQKRYIQGVAGYVAPAMVFTFILFITFMVTVYLVVRQKKVTEMKNDFVHNMTHEFKTPISTISIAAQMLADKSLDKSPETYERLGGVINNETLRLRFHVEKVLQMSLFDHNNIALKLSEIDANEVIDAVVQTFSLKVTQSGGSIETSLEAIDPFVNADEMHFTNIIFNLMDNAVKYRREDVELHLEVSTWNQGNSICIQISDNGIGIRREDLKRIFEKFYRVHTGNKHNVKGFGLGLAYVYKMVVLHHGTIKATSELNKGTKFLITMPLSMG